MDVPIKGINSEEVKLARDLSTGKKVDNEQLFICEGLWAVEKIIKKRIKVEMFFFCPDMIKTEQDKKKTNLMIEYCKDSYQISQKACRKISDRDGADGFFIICHMPRYDIEKLPLKDDMLVMVLDGLEQPGNVGVTIRSLDAAGGDFAIMTNRRVRLTHSRVIRASLGAAFMMPVCVCDMAEVVKWLVKNKFKIIVTDLTAKKSYYDIDYSGRVCIVAGNEYLGISPDWRHVEGAIPCIIPMLGSVESLNVGFASTIVAYEARRYKSFIN